MERIAQHKSTVRYRQILLKNSTLFPVMLLAKEVDQ
jgi:hypothetical protein